MKKLRFFGSLALALLLAFTFMTCDSGSGTGKAGTGDDGITDDRPIVSYTATKNSVTYTLVTGPIGAKAVHLPGDFFILTAKKNTEEKEITGTIVDFLENVFTLLPSNKEAVTFTVTINGAKITNISGTVTYTDGSTEQGPGAFPTGGGGGGGGGTGNNTGTNPGTAPSISTSSSLPGGKVGTAYSQTLTASGTTPITWTLDGGTMAPGLSISPTGVISGTPSAPGPYTFTVKASNSAGSSIKALSIVITEAPTITTTSLASGAQGIPYNETLAATGTTPITWSITSGSISPLTLDASTGKISGTPSAATTYSFTVQATNSAGSGTKALTIDISPAGSPTIDPVSADSGTVNVAYSVTMTASNGPISWSVVSGSLPTNLTLNASTGVISGTPTAWGIFDFTVQATNGSGNATIPLNISIMPRWVNNGGGTTFNLSTEDDLAGLAFLVSDVGADLSGMTVNLTANLNLTSYPNWTSIGIDSDSFRPFSGTFDGGGHTISNLKIIMDSYNSARGLFGYIYPGGVVKNLTLSGVSITGNNYGWVGGVAGTNYGTVENCSVGVTANVTSIQCVGGVVGFNPTPGTVENCSVTGSVTGTDCFAVGGVVGDNSYTVQNCYSTVSVTSTRSTGDVSVGGVVGRNDRTVQNCYSTGSVTGTSSTGYAYVGGVVGCNYASGTVQNCYSTGSVTGGGGGVYTDDSVGGVVGHNSGSTVKNCVALNPSITRSSGTDTGFGRVVGYKYSGTLTANYARNDMKFINESSVSSTTFPSGTPPYTNANNENGADVSTGDAKTQATWTTAGFTFGGTSPWVWNASGMPSLSGVGMVQAWPF